MQNEEECSSSFWFSPPAAGVLLMVLITARSKSKGIETALLTSGARVTVPSQIGVFAL
jgi:hypothetical protein